MDFDVWHDGAPGLMGRWCQNERSIEEIRRGQLDICIRSEDYGGNILVSRGFVNDINDSTQQYNHLQEPVGRLSIHDIFQKDETYAIPVSTRTGVVR